MEHNINEVKNIEQFENYGRAQAFIEAMQLDTLYECFKYLEPNVNIDDIEQCNWHDYEWEFSICVHNYDCCDWDIYNIPAKVFDYWMEGEKDKALDLYKKTIKTEKWKDPRETK